MSTINSSATINANELASIFSHCPEPFAIIYRPESSPDESVDVFTCDVKIVEEISEITINRKHNKTGDNSYSTLALIPYRQIKERGFDFVDDHTPLVVMEIKTQTKLPKKSLVEYINSIPITLAEGHYDIDDDEYAEIARSIITEEIRKGAGANFVLKRSYISKIGDYNIQKALSIFRNVLEREVGAYWIFIVYTGDMTLIGATPERHVSLSERKITMNPISGTYRYPKTGPTVRGLMDFLEDNKEVEELYMVVDEELKMMSRICDAEPTLTGPYIKEMTKLAHTEYLIEGTTFLSPQKIIKETLFAPTITGSPLENAFRVIKKYEPNGRGYYGGVISLFGSDKDGLDYIDSSILIRTAQIQTSGELKISVGSTLIRNSNPITEAFETTTKAAGLLSAIEQAQSEKNPNSPAFNRINFHELPEVQNSLKSRNSFISNFWQKEFKQKHGYVSSLQGLKTLIVDAEDTFTSMLFHVLRALGLNVVVAKYDEHYSVKNFDVIVLGPGPGNPENANDIRIINIGKTIENAIFEGIPFLAICLSHQILCSYLGINISLKESPNQGLQKEIDLFGDKERVGFYNSYTGISTTNKYSTDQLGVIEISRDEITNEVYALRGEAFSSMQFHPESILTQNGVDILEKRLVEIFSNKNKNLFMLT